MIAEATIAAIIPTLEKLVETGADKTARALVKHGGGKADLARVAAALKSGSWPKSGDPAEEAAAFAHHLLRVARVAEEDMLGVCWEYRGEVAP